MKLVMKQPTATAFGSTPVDDHGCVDIVWNSNAAGSYSLDAYQLIDGKNVLIGHTTFNCQ